MTPIRYGNYVCKYRMLPTGTRKDSYLSLLERLATHSDGLRLALEETLAAEDIHFDFQIQLWNSTKSMPLDDATVEWPESESPFRTVARLTLPNRRSRSYETRPNFASFRSASGTPSRPIDRLAESIACGGKFIPYRRHGVGRKSNDELNSECLPLLPDKRHVMLDVAADPAE